MAKNHYCKNCNNHGHGGSNFTSGLVFGAIVGATLGVLFAPQEGEKTRKKLKEVSGDLSEKGKKLANEAELLIEDAKIVAAPLIKELEKNVAPLLKKAQASGKEVQIEVLEKIEQLVDEVEDAAEGVGKRTKKMFKGVKK